MRKRFLITSDVNLLETLDIYFKLKWVGSRSQWFKIITNEFLTKNKKDIKETCNSTLQDTISSIL